MSELPMDNKPAVQKKAAEPMKPTDKKGTLDVFMQRSLPSLARLAVRDADGSKLAQMILNETIRNPMLLECSPTSVVLAMAEWLGSSIRVAKNFGAIVPVKIKGRLTAQFWPMYQGLLDLAYQSGKLEKISVRAVYEGELFVLSYGTEDIIQHIPIFPPPPPEEQWDKLVATYCCIWLKDAKNPVWAMPVSKMELEWLQKNASSQSGPWHTHPVEMSLKSSCKRSLKLSPVTPELQAAIEADDAAEMGVHTGRTLSSMADMGDIGAADAEEVQE